MSGPDYSMTTGGVDQLDLDRDAFDVDGGLDGGGSEIDPNLKANFGAGALNGLSLETLDVGPPGADVDWTRAADALFGHIAVD